MPEMERIAKSLEGIEDLLEQLVAWHRMMALCQKEVTEQTQQAMERVNASVSPS